MNLVVELVLFNFNSLFYLKVNMYIEVHEHLGQPVAEVLAYLHVQISPISCNVVGSILHVLGKNTDTAIVGYRWTAVGGHHAQYC